MNIITYCKTFFVFGCALFVVLMATYDVHGYISGHIGDAEYLKVYYENDDNLRSIMQSNLIIDQFLFDEMAFTCYADTKHINLLNELNIRYHKVPTTAELFEDPAYRAERKGYRTFQNVVDELIYISNENPGFTQLINIGQSVQGRPLYFLRLTADIQNSPVKPEFHYISTMHGNEKVGTELCMEFIYYLLDNYGNDTFVTGLLDDIDFYIMPVMNPDGFVANTRANANGIDLNRNFPDFITNPEDTTVGKQLETIALMLFYAQRRGVLSANFHTGALCVNYPWDATLTPHPETEMLIELSLLYSINNPPMYNSSNFPNGITNGAQWYIIHGGMQDYSSYYHSNLQTTIELSNQFQPPASTLPQLWLNNKYSMLYYSGAMRRGIQGFIKDSGDLTPVKANIIVEGIDWVFSSDQENGFFHKMLMPGEYTVHISAEGYYSKTLTGLVIEEGWDHTLYLGDILLTEDLEYISLNYYEVQRFDKLFDPKSGDALHPGEQVGLMININNESPEIIDGLSAVISSENEYFTIVQSFSYYPDMGPGTNAGNSSLFMVEVSEDCPHNELIIINFEWSFGSLQGCFDFAVPVKSRNIVEIGNGDTELEQAPFYVYYEDNRTQVIYLSQELPDSAFDINAMALFVSKIPEKTMNNFTIRMQHTEISSYSTSSAFLDSGWTVVYQKNETVSETGWVDFVFNNAFEYNGNDNLLIDISFNNNSWVNLNLSGRCRWTPCDTQRTMYAYSDSNHGDPLLWSGANSPPVHRSTHFLNIVLYGDYTETQIPDSALFSFSQGNGGIFQWDNNDGWSNLLKGAYADKIEIGDFTGDGEKEIIACFNGLGLFYHDNNSWNLITDGMVHDFTLSNGGKGEGVNIAASVEGIGTLVFVFNGPGNIEIRIISHETSYILCAAGTHPGIAVAFHNVSGLFFYDLEMEKFFRVSHAVPSHIYAMDTNNNGNYELIAGFEGLGIFVTDISDITKITWNRILNVVPEHDHYLSSGKIIDNGPIELICSIEGRTYYYSFPLESWHKLADAPFDLILSGKWTQGPSCSDDLLLSSRELSSIYLYASGSNAFQRLLSGIYAVSMTAY